jgi:hypothetical protein
MVRQEVGSRNLLRHKQKRTARRLQLQRKAEAQDQGEDGSDGSNDTYIQCAMNTLAVGACLLNRRGDIRAHTHTLASQSELLPILCTIRWGEASSNGR